MGLKSGSRDAGLDEEEETENEQTAVKESEQQQQSDPDSEASTGEDDQQTVAIADQEESQSESARPSMDSIPYKLRRNKVNEGRDQVPFFLREHVIEGEEDLQDSLEAMLSENVYKSDYREAAMLVAQRNPELVAEVLREWGYDLE